MADYTSPKPIDPIWYQRSAFLHITCACGRRATYPLADFARFHRLSRDMLLYKVIDRLRCQICGKRPLRAEVTRAGGF